MKKVGFIGLGLMGGPMAANVAQAGFPLTVYNRTRSKAEAHKALGAQLAASPAEVGAEAEVVITMLSDAAAVREVLFGPEGVLAGDGQPTVIDMSTIAPDQSQSISARLAESGLKMLDAPVTGSTGPAEQGTLGILVGGEEAVLEEYRDLLKTMGTVYYFGPQGSGTLAKMAFNLMVGAQIVSLAEAMVLAAKGGIDLKYLGDIIGESGLASNLIKRKIPRIVNGDHDPAFPLKHMQKDLGLMVRTSDKLEAPIPATGINHQLYTAAKAQGLAEKDFAAIYLLLAELASL
jgi:3-hydroxyisobutyrate dehydrogenase